MKEKSSIQPYPQYADFHSSHRLKIEFGNSVGGATVNVTDDDDEDASSEIL
jgi:hypothetical protein